MKRISLFIWGILIVFLVIVLLLLSGCGKNPPKIKIGYIKVSSCLPLFVALENDYFQEQGIAVEPVLFANSNEGSNAMITGQVDGIVGFGLSTLYSIEANTPGKFRIYMPCVETKEKFVNQFLVRKDSTFTSIADLKGKRVGTYEGTSLLKVLLAVLEKFMDPQKEVTVIQVATPLQIQALQAGQFDALFTIEPYATIGIEQGVAKVLEENPRVKYLLAPFPAGVNAFNQSFIEKYPQAVKKIYAAMIKAVDFIRTNEADAKKFLPKYTPVEAHIAEKSNIYQWWKAEETDVDNLQAYADLLQRLNLLPKRVRVEPMVLKRTQLQ